MEKHILIGIDGSPASMAAAEYAGALFGKAARVKVDLTHILPGLSPLFLEPGEDMKEMGRLQAFSEKVWEENIRRAGSMMEEASGALTRAGVLPENIAVLIEEPAQGVAGDILDMEQKGSYDAILLGRHGAGAGEEFVMGSVTNKVLQHAREVPVCVVQGTNLAQKILVTVDMSPNSKRVLDLVGWLVADGDPAEIDIFHVLDPLVPKEMASMWTGLTEMEATVEQRLTQDAEDALSQAKTYLTEKGVSPFMVTSHLEAKTTDVTRAILQQAKDGDFGTVIVGRRGISRTKRFLFGSVSHRIVQEARNMAVWVVC